MVYKLRCTLEGHGKDVRSVQRTLVPDGGIISGSRDITARIWLPTEDSFVEGTVFSGHEGFVSCVCVLPASEEHPNGLIATGSNDKTINIYSLDSPLPIRRLTGHTNTVCSLATGKFGTLLSGSWDNTAKVWLNYKNVMTLSGHEQAVWCVVVIPANGLMITGSADKNIKIWKAGKCTTTLTGHSDCVRDLAVISDREFLSCSNDTSIRRWSIDGRILQVYQSHMNYVYSICLLPNGGFASVGEDRNLKIWRNDVCEQTIAHPATSVWCVGCLDNGDIITGSSDHQIRVFSSDSGRQAAAHIIAAYEEEVASSEIPAQSGNAEEFKNLPGVEKLDTPGTKEGQVLMINNSGNIEAYQWDTTADKWCKVGDVVGSSGGSTGRKRMEYLGKEYDYVFDIELSEGGPVCKLPYDLTEEPYAAAQRFIDDNELDQGVLDQIRNFIVENTQSAAIQQIGNNDNYQDPFTGAGAYRSSGPVSQTGGTDPFTGAGRYVPNGASNNMNTASGADPFTGSGSYRPAGDNSVNASNPYYPVSQYLSFTQSKPEAAIRKLKEFNQSLSPDMKCADSDLNILTQLCDLTQTPTAPMLKFLWKLLQWPKEKIFPVLDITRISILHPLVNEQFCNPQEGPNFLQHITQYFSDQNSTNHQLTIKIIVNLFLNEPGRALLLENLETLLPLMIELSKDPHKQKRLAISTLILNYSIQLQPTNLIEYKSQLITAIVQLSMEQNEAESKFRLGVALGNLIDKDTNSRVLASSLGLADILKTWKSESSDQKLSECCKCLIETLK